MKLQTKIEAINRAYAKAVSNAVDEAERPEKTNDTVFLANGIIDLIEKMAIDLDTIGDRVDSYKEQVKLYSAELNKLKEKQNG